MVVPRGPNCMGGGLLGPIILIWQLFCQCFVFFFWLRFLSGHGSGRLCLVDWFLIGLFFVQVSLNCWTFILETLMVILLFLFFVNPWSFSVLCLFLDLLTLCSLLLFSLAFVDSWKVRLDNPAVNIRKDTVYCLDKLFCRNRRKKWER